MIKPKISIILLLGLILTSFSTAFAQPPPPLLMERPLIAGQNYIVGNIAIRRDPTNLYFEYNVKPEYRLTEVHLHYGQTLDDFPLTKKGSPKVGHFMYSAEFEEGVMRYKFIIPWESDDLPKLWAAHAVVIGVSENAEFEEETAWAKGMQFEGKDWGMYFKLKPEFVILKIGPSFDQGPVGIGDPEGIDVINDGNAVAHNVTLVMTIPTFLRDDGFTMTAFIIQQINPTPDSYDYNVVTWNLGDIAPGTNKGVTFKVYPHKLDTWEVEITASCPEASMTIHPTIELVE